MKPQDDDLEDDRFAELLGAAGYGAPPADRAFLDQLRDRSLDAFLNAAPSPTDSASPSPRPRRAMKPLVFRTAGAVIAAAVLIAVAWQFWPTHREETTLARVLDRAADADGLHLQVTRADRTDDVWVSRSNKLRWDESAERYLIVRGGRRTASTSPQTG